MSTPSAEIPTRAVNHFALSAFWFGTSFHWLLLLLILIPANVSHFVGDAAKGSYLGLLLGTGAIVALVLPPIVGAYSDRVGKRMALLRAGMLINVLGLAVMGGASILLDSFTGYVVYFLGYMIVQFGNNLATAPYTALIPQLVAPEQRGRASGAMAFLQASGQLLGAIAFLVVSALKLPALASFALVAVVLFVAASITVRFVPEPPPVQREQGEKLSVWQLFTFNAFLWVFVTRVFFSLGQYSVQPFIQFYMGDVLGQRANAATLTSVMLVCIIAGSVTTALTAGRFADRFGRKPVIYVAGTLMATCALLFLVAPNLPVALALAVVFGFGFGAFNSVDWALGADALPSAKSYARDMGVWHVAAVAPQLSSAPQGFLLDWGNGRGDNLGYVLVFGLAAAFFMLGVILVRNIRNVR
ncbi:MFS transporter [Deinococcus yavapaiensis]|uniref:MFS transporter n=1 Tax=Deinococcus yavapaiensis KR-236 TaxID=694435 RepID=A0A318SKZ4_9DEIO|nr:MFS transporter [Deinococcus yavapaiensis]PYE55179.1 MFS transporter [Deinococcus yavapaiensis KR-236]